MSTRDQRARGLCAVDITRCRKRRADEQRLTVPRRSSSMSSASATAREAPDSARSGSKTRALSPAGLERTTPRPHIRARPRRMPDAPPFPTCRHAAVFFRSAFGNRKTDASRAPDICPVPLRLSHTARGDQPGGPSSSRPVDTRVVCPAPSTSHSFVLRTPGAARCRSETSPRPPPCSTDLARALRDQSSF